MDHSFDYILAFGAMIIGILILTGHGEFFLKGGNDAMRKSMYDEKKMEKATGIAMLLIGVATFVDTFTTGFPAKVAYIGVVILIFVGMIVYVKKKCRKR